VDGVVLFAGGCAGVLGVLGVLGWVEGAGSVVLLLFLPLSLQAERPITESTATDAIRNFFMMLSFIIQSLGPHGAKVRWENG
jgi:hypothetical protein